MNTNTVIQYESEESQLAIYTEFMNCINFARLRTGHSVMVEDWSAVSHAWLDANINHSWRCIGHYWWFEHGDDAALFRLTWL